MKRNELRYLRLKNKLTQRQMCDILKISCDRYSRIERGYTAPTEKEWKSIAGFLGIHEEEWLS